MKIVFTFLAVVICFIIAVKALSSITTVIFDNTYTVCLDPGHGGDDFGAVLNSAGRYEKDDNLRLAMLVKEELEKFDIKVILTREDDTFVSLKQRCRIANKSRADIFVSLHRNSSSSGSGMEIWIKDNPEEKEIELAEDILSALTQSSSLMSRGVKKGFRDSSGNNYYVNANTNMPSCLVEVGFISNIEDNKNFDENINNYAKGIAKAIYESLVD